MLPLCIDVFKEYWHAMRISVLLWSYDFSSIYDNLSCQWLLNKIDSHSHEIIAENIYTKLQLQVSIAS